MIGDTWKDAYAAKNANVKRFVYSSSSTYYGNRESPQNEDMLPNLLNPYALSKYVGEQYCELWTPLYGLSTKTSIPSLRALTLLTFDR